MAATHLTHWQVTRRLGQPPPYRPQGDIGWREASEPTLPSNGKVVEMSRGCILATLPPGCPAGEPRYCAPAIRSASALMGTAPKITLTERSSIDLAMFHCPECGHRDGCPSADPVHPVQRWDRRLDVIAHGWLAGRCGNCGSRLDMAR